MKSSLIIYSDGGSRGNPGPAAVGFVIKNKSGKTIFETGRSIGPATNNTAEYTAVIQALGKAYDLGGTRVDCFLDSELVVRQLNGVYKIKDLKIKGYVQRVAGLVGKFQNVTFNHIPRSINRRADFLVNAALDSRI